MKNLVFATVFIGACLQEVLAGHDARPVHPIFGSPVQYESRVARHLQVVDTTNEPPTNGSSGSTSPNEPALPLPSVLISGNVTTALPLDAIEAAFLQDMKDTMGSAIPANATDAEIEALFNNPSALANLTAQIQNSTNSSSEASVTGGTVVGNSSEISLPEKTNTTNTVNPEAPPALSNESLANETSMPPPPPKNESSMPPMMNNTMPPPPLMNLTAKTPMNGSAMPNETSNSTNSTMKPPAPEAKPSNTSSEMMKPPSMSGNQSLTNQNRTENVPRQNGTGPGEGEKPMNGSMMGNKTHDNNQTKNETGKPHKPEKPEKPENPEKPGDGEDRPGQAIDLDEQDREIRKWEAEMFRDRPGYDEEEFKIYYEEPVTKRTFEPEPEGEDFYEKPIKDKKKDEEPESTGRLSEKYNAIYRYYSAYYTWRNPANDRLYESKKEERYDYLFRVRSTYYWDTTGRRETHATQVDDGGLFEMVGRMFNLW